MAKVEINDSLARLLERQGIPPTTAVWTYLVGLKLLDWYGYNGLLSYLRHHFGWKELSKACTRVSEAEHAAINEASQKVDSSTLVRSGAAVYRVGP